MSDNGEEFGRAIMTELDARKAKEQAIITAYESGDPWIMGHVVSEYRCRRPRRGCLLLYVWHSRSDQLEFYQPAYKLSPGRNAEQSNESGRAANTADGNNHWRAVAGVLDDMRGWGPTAGLSLQCDHVSVTVPSDDLLATADDATPGRPTRRTI